MNHTYRYVFFSSAEMYVEARIYNEPMLAVKQSVLFAEFRTLAPNVWRGTWK